MLKVFLALRRKTNTKNYTGINEKLPYHSLLLFYRYN
jgi:hypothetical protein